jgi:hypothetical protein
MSTDPGSYQQELLLALRMRDIPGPRIAEALAEVDSHVAETGEDPYAAFGEPKGYADRLRQALHREDGGRLGPRRRVMSSGVVALVSFAGALLLTDGLLSLGAGDRGLAGLPAVVPAITGLVLLAALGGWLAARLRRNADRVLDPRTGRDMAPPLSRWMIAVMVAVPAGTLLVALLLAVAGR